MRLTWRKQPSETGLRRMFQGPLGATLRVDGNEVGRVTALRVDHYKWNGWWWNTMKGHGVSYKSTYSAPVATLDEAKAQCEAYVRQCLGLPAKKDSE